MELHEELSDDEIEARQRAADGETQDTDPKVGDDPAGNVDPAQAADTTAAVDDKSAAPETAAADPAAAAADPAAAPAAGGDAPAKVEGVLSKDGTRVLPYAALQAERRSARAASAKADRLANELAAAQQLIEDLKAGKTPDTGVVTEEDVRDMEENFPEQGKKMRALFEAAKAATPAAPASDPDPGEAEDPVQEAIDQVPLLLEWQHGDAEKFARAIEHDTVLRKSPKWADKPAVDRFTEVARRVADEFDIPFPSPKTSTQTAGTAAPANAAAPQSAAVQAAQRKPPETLSDFKGGSVADHNSMDVAKASPRALLSRMEEMSDEQIDAHLAKYG